MGKTSNESKDLWNRTHYVQIKVNADPEIAEAFKAACDENGVPMARVLSECMREYAGLRRAPLPLPPVDTRRKRRKETGELLVRLERILDAETAAAENTPENLRGSERHEETEAIVAALEDVLDALRDVYA